MDGKQGNDQGSTAVGGAAAPGTSWASDAGRHSERASTGDLPRVLVIGYGNPGRLDDGLGPALAALLEEQQLPGVTVEADYQLTVEDAADIARHDVVVFADASVSGPEPFSFRPVAHDDQLSLGFTSHSLLPGSALALARNLFASQARGYILAIRGYEFNEFGERLSAAAQANLAAAVRFLADALVEGLLTSPAPVTEPSEEE